MVVTGAAGPLGRRVLAALLAEAPASDIVAVDKAKDASYPSGVEAITADLLTVDLKELLGGADVLVHLAFVISLDNEGAARRRNRELTRKVLDAAGAVSLSQLVIVSSALVYGAWANNPVPITEAQPLRPNPGFGYATEKAEIERVVSAWADDHESTSVAVLRPALAVSAGDDSWIAAVLRSAAPILIGDDDPPFQFLHLDDLATAVGRVVLTGVPGAFNVAPDRWLTGDEVRALLGPRPRLRLPEPVALRIAKWAWRWRLRPVPPGLLPYIRQPWVVANDRLRETGWVPQWTNEETFVVADDAPPWVSMNARQRQVLSLVGAGVVVAGLAAALVAVIRAIQKKLRRLQCSAR